MQKKKKKKQDKKGGKYEKFKNYFPFLKYYFTSCPTTFSNFALYILRNVFDFQSMNQEQVSTLFSMFSQQPKFEQISNLLKISTFHIEIPHLLAQLIFNENKSKVITNFEASPNMQTFCNKLKLDKNEFVLILKLCMDCMSVEDLDTLFQIFQLNNHFDTSFIKGLYSFITPEFLFKGNYNSLFSYILIDYC